MAHAAARQGLDGVAADAADAEDGHPSRRQTLHARPAQQQLRPGKFIQHSASSVPWSSSSSSTCCPRAVNARLPWWGKSA